MSEDNAPVFLPVGEFLRDGKPSPIASEVRDQLESKRRATALDDAILRQQEDWSFLAKQVVGGEERASR